MLNLTEEEEAFVEKIFASLKQTKMQLRWLGLGEVRISEGGLLDIIARLDNLLTEANAKYRVAVKRLNDLDEKLEKIKEAGF